MMSKLRFLSFNRSSVKKPSSPKPTLHHTYSKEIKKSSSFTEEIRRIFSKFDANGDGKISLEEYKQAVEVLGGATDAWQTFRLADEDGDGFIDFDEFMKVYGSDGGVKSSEIQAAFRVFDRDGDGKISAGELMEVLRRMGEKCSLEGCKKMIKGVDRDGDGLINMDEFTSMMMHNIKLISN